MNDKDTDLLTEAYSQMQEGLRDRIKARGAGWLGNVKGAPTSIAARAKGAIAGIKGDAETVKSTHDQVKQSGFKSRGTDAKSLSITFSHLRKLTKLAADFKNDLSKTGMDIETIRTTNPEAAAALTSLQTAITQVTNAFQGGGNRVNAINNLKKRVNRVEPPKLNKAVYTSQTTPQEREVLKKLNMKPKTESMTIDEAYNALTSVIEL